jgi:hypothetical protein
MSTGETVAVVVVILAALALVALLLRMQLQRRHLQDRFGPEYERKLRESENRRQAERELADREKRYAELDIHPLDPAKRDQYAADWQQVQERFVDTPGEALADADRLVMAVMRERGYPTEGYDQQVSDLSVAHARTIEHYRAAHDISARGGDSTTEDMRRAMVHYRSIFADLLGPAGQERTDDRRDQPPEDERADGDGARHLGGKSDATR